MTFRKEVIDNATLFLGDCSEIIQDLGAVDCVVSDPPFGMSFRSNHRSVRHSEIANDSNTDALLWACNLSARHSKYIFARWDNLAHLPKPRSLVTWVKNNWSMGDLLHEHGRQTEVDLFYPGPDHFFPKGRPSDVIHAPRTGNEYHPTEKPTQLMRAIVEWTDGVVLDPFMGSGTTGVACAKLGRKFVGIEIEPTYFDIAVKRIEKAYAEPDMFIERPAPPVQEPLFGKESA